MNVTIVVACMDKRLVETLMKDYDSQSTVIVSNAGGNTEPIKKTIEKLRKQGHTVEKIVVMTHDDCGAMKLVYGELKEGKSLEPKISEYLIKGKFKESEFETPEQLYKSNAAKESERVKEMAKEIGGDVKVISAHIPKELLGLKHTDEPNTLVVSRSTLGGYRETFKGLDLKIGKTYAIIQDRVLDRDKEDKILRDIMIALKLNVNKIYFVADNKNDLDDMNDLARRVTNMTRGQNMDIRVIEKHSSSRKRK